MADCVFVRTPASVSASTNSRTFLRSRSTRHGSLSRIDSAADAPAIAAGTGDEAKQIYGDVIVPDVIWDYSTGKFVGPDETEIRFGDIGFLPRPRSVYTSPEIIEIIKNTMGREDNEFHVHIGPLACGSSVVANRAVVEKQVLSLFPRTVGLDMESYSVAFTCHSSRAPQPTAIIIKSICDFADSEKSDQYQKFAAYTSSGYAKYLLENHLPLD